MLLCTSSTSRFTRPLVQRSSWMQIRWLSQLVGGTCERLTVVSLNDVLRRIHFAKPQRSRYRRRHRNGEGRQIVTTSIFLYTRPVYQNNSQEATNTNRGKIDGVCLVLATKDINIPLHACGSENVYLRETALIKKGGVRWLALWALEKKYTLIDTSNEDLYRLIP